jgi:hypothetical protein
MGATKWVRTNPVDIERISLVVKQEVDKDVFDWLQSLPYGKANASIKEAIRFYIKNSVGNISIVQNNMEEKPVAVINRNQPIEKEVAQSFVAVSPSFSENISFNGDAVSNSASIDNQSNDIDEASLELLQSMNDRF